jgi:hypothetical protein
MVPSTQLSVLALVRTQSRSKGRIYTSFCRVVTSYRGRCTSVTRTHLCAECGGGTRKQNLEKQALLLALNYYMDNRLVRYAGGSRVMILN